MDSDGHAKLTDFGLSRILNDPGAEKHMTLCGTPSWTAPEILSLFNRAGDLFF